MSSLANIDSRLLEALKSSTCFGIAYDPTTPECQECDLSAQCKAKEQNANIPLPEIKVKKTKIEDAPKGDEEPVAKKPKSDKPSPKVDKTPTPASKPVTASKPQSQNKPKDVKPPNPNMPDFKQFSTEDLKAEANKNNIAWKDYGNENITRMRIIMSLKKLYE